MLEGVEKRKDALSLVFSNVNPVKNDWGLQIRAKLCFSVSQELHLWIWEMGPWNLLCLVQPWVGDVRKFW